ncbi:hypothetical protein JCM8547_007940 [Rhodosporidiobolus lusitaniae]
MTTKIRDPLFRFSAHVEVDGAPVPVYKIEQSGDKKTTCFIEAVEGREFKVIFTNEAFYDTSLAALLHLDGQESDGYTIKHQHQPATFDCKRVSATSVRPFVFSKLATTDDADEATNDEKVVKNLGTIQIEIYRVTVLGEAYASVSFKQAKEHVFDERSKKATLSHQAGFGAEKIKVDTGRRSELHWIDPYTQPFRILEFKYRSRALLELDGIVEDNPFLLFSLKQGKLTLFCQQRLNKKRAVISLLPDYDEEEDLRSKVARLQAENAKLKKVKREPNAESGSSSKVKKEKVVISLLDDSD